MSQVIPIDSNQGLAERFWGIARLMDTAGRDHNDPVSMVRHVLAILDALDRGESGADLSVRTLSFLKLLRQSEKEGDFAYASPEQIRGETLDERSLVFSVGVLLFERLTGRHPFGAEGNSPRRVARIRRGELGSGVNYFPTVPAGLRSVLMRAMGPFPEERFSSLAELRARLEQFLNDQAPAPRLPGTAPSGSGPVTVSPAAQPAPAATAGTASGAAAGSAPDSAPDSVEQTVIVRAPTAFARDLMAAADAHNANVKARRRRQRGTPAPLGLARVVAEPARPAATRDSAPALRDSAPATRDSAPALRDSAPALRDSAPALRDSAPALRARDASHDAVTSPSALRQTADEPGARGDEISRATTVPLPPRKTRPPAHVVEEDEDVRPARDGVMGKLVWLGLGAGVAVAIMLVIGLVMWPRGNAPASSAEPPAPAAEPEQPAMAVAAEPEPEPAVFDAGLGGQQAVELARACFSPAQLSGGVRFRAGLLYPAREGGVSRVYFAPTQEIAASERVCVREKLLGLVAGGTPESSLVVDYQIHLTATGGDAEIK